MTLEKYLRQAFDSFRHDPADNSFQRGYLWALIAVAEAMEADVECSDIGKMIIGPTTENENADQNRQQ